MPISTHTEIYLSGITTYTLSNFTKNDNDLTMSVTFSDMDNQSRSDSKVLSIPKLENGNIDFTSLDKKLEFNLRLINYLNFHLVDKKGYDGDYILPKNKEMD